MTKHYILNEDGSVSECDLMTWAEFFKNDDKRRIALDENIDGHTISTVFLGLNHNYGDGPPLIFETLVYGPQYSKWDEWMVRYSTKREALMGHEEIIRRIKNGEEPGEM